MSAIPFAAINAAALASFSSLLREWFPSGVQIGQEYVLGDLRGSPGRSLKINMNTGAWGDFAGGDKGGDPISLKAAAFHHNDQAAAAKDLGRQLGVYMNGADVAKPSYSNRLEAVVCPEQKPPIERFKHWTHGQPSHVWFYRDANGVLLCVTARYPTKKSDGSPDKEFKPWTYGCRIWTDKHGKPNKILGWHNKALPAPRPLYGLDRLTARPDALVVVCEGEKAADAAETMFPGVVGISPMNGAKSPGKSDWTPLQGRAVAIWPDNDEPGAGFAAKVGRLVTTAGASAARVVDVPKEWPAKWDLADAPPEGVTPERLLEMLDEAPAWVGKDSQKPRPEPVAVDALAPLTALEAPEHPHLDGRQAYHALRDELDKSNNGAILTTHANLVAILKRDTLLSGLVLFNAFSGLHMLRKPVPTVDKAMRASPGPYPRAWDGDDVTRLLAYVQKAWAPNFKRATVEDCLLLEGRDNEVHDVRDFLDGLKWDGTPRLDMWLSKTFGCPEDGYHTAVGSKLLIAAVRRVRKPGCKHDHLVVFEGPQGILKSTAIAVLFGANWTTDQVSNLASKDAAIDLRGKWGVEFPEIEHLIKNDVETVKAFLSRPVDHYRPPYGRTAVDVPRQCVLVGTTNATEYLRDATGNRRIWPVKCLSAGADLVWLRANRDQLWAEAAHREADGESIWLNDDTVREVATQEQSARFAEDPWQGKVEAYLSSVSGRVTIPELFDHALFVPTGQQTKALQMRVGDILKGLDWEKKLIRIGEKPIRAWVPKA